VRETEVAVVTTFSRFSRSIDQTRPWPFLRWPWPVQDVYKFDNRLQMFQTKFDQSITGDQINILSKVYVAWRIADPRVFLERLHGRIEEAEKYLEPVVRNAKNEVLGAHVFGDLVSTNAAGLKFDKIEKEILDRVQARARSEYGITVHDLGLEQLGLPESITSTVFERMKAERQRLVSTYQSEGEREASIIRAQADNQAREIVSSARGEAIRIVGGAERRAQEYYAVFQRNPELAVFLFQLKALEESLKDRAHLVLDEQTPPFNLLRGGAKPAPAAGAK
jgi:membrane protease subunit HflC